MVYIAGADHLPVKCSPLRQVIGPRPPAPPTPKLNFFTFGITMTHSALLIKSGGMFLLLSISPRPGAAPECLLVFILIAAARRSVPSHEAPKCDNFSLRK